MQMMVRYDAMMSVKKEQAVTRNVLTNFLAGEEEEPLERQFNLDFNLPFNTVDRVLLETLLHPDSWHHAWISENIVVGPRAC